MAYKQMYSMTSHRGTIMGWYNDGEWSIEVRCKELGYLGSMVGMAVNLLRDGVLFPKEFSLDREEPTDGGTASE